MNTQDVGLNEVLLACNIIFWILSLVAGIAFISIVYIILTGLAMLSLLEFTLITGLLYVLCKRT